MAHSKNSNRRKRKYTEARKSATERNRKRRQQRHARRLSSLTARTQSLIGQYVAVRVKDRVKPQVGTVQEVIDKSHVEYPHDAKRRHGKYLKVRTTFGDLIASRHRVKPIKDK